MAQIQPISIWKDGQVKTASEFTLRIIADDLATSCTFYYELKEGDVVSQDSEGNDVTTQGAVLSVGNESMSGQDYQDWDGSNGAAYSYVAGKLNIILV